MVGALEPALLGKLQGAGLPEPATAAVQISDRLVVGAKQARHVRQQNALSTTEWRALPMLVGQPSSIYLDTRNRHLIFVAEGAGPMKAALEFDTNSSQVGSAFRTAATDVAGMVKGGLWKPLN